MQYRKMIILMVIFGLCFSSTAMAYDQAPEQENFKVVGYYSGGLFDEPVARLQMDKLTHVMYAFLIPKADGTLVPLEKPEQLRAIVEKARTTGTKVFISVGGYSYQNALVAPAFETLAATTESRAVFIENLLNFVRAYDLDGVELDWEYPLMTSGQQYEDLVVALGDALHRENKALTAALNGAWSVTDGPEVSQLVTAKCLATFDFINVMSYDMNNEDHSPLWFAETSMAYWLARDVAPSKIVLGMPLYASPSWMQYRDLVALDANNAYLNQLPAGHGCTLPSYYNGLNVLREKTVAALRNVGGVMLFDINEDTNDSYSALTMIDGIVQKAQEQGGAAFAREITLIIDGRPLNFTAEENLGIPHTDANNRTLIPLRKSLETIGATVIYDDVTQTITITKDATTVVIKIGQPQIIVNGQVVAMDTEAILDAGRTYIPARAVFTAFGYQVDWHQISQTIYLQGTL